MKDELQESYQKALAFPLERILVPERGVKLSGQQANAVINSLAERFGIPPEVALTFTIHLFLRGAANKSTPLSLEVVILRSPNPKAGFISVTKKDLLECYTDVMKNPHLRRLAEALSGQISYYAEVHGLSGDLAKQVNLQIQSMNEPPLTPKERAWCSSFCQERSNLSVEGSPRLPFLLARDYQVRYPSQAPHPENFLNKGEKKPGSNVSPPPKKRVGETPPIKDSRSTPTLFNPKNSGVISPMPNSKGSGVGGAKPPHPTTVSVENAPPATFVEESGVIPSIEVVTPPKKRQAKGGKRASKLTAKTDTE